MSQLGSYKSNAGRNQISHETLYWMDLVGGQVKTHRQPCVSQCGAITTSGELAVTVFVLGVINQGFGPNRC